MLITRRKNTSVCLFLAITVLFSSLFFARFAKNEPSVLKGLNINLLKLLTELEITANVREIITDV